MSGVFPLNIEAWVVATEALVDVLGVVAELVVDVVVFTEETFIKERLISSNEFVE